MVGLIQPILRKLGDNLPLVGEVVLLAVLLLLILVPDWPVGMVTVYCVPDATVRTGDGMRLSTPAVIPVPQGGVSVSLSAPNRVPVDTVLRPHSASLTVELPYLFEVNVVSEPPGAIVYLNGVRSGSTPVSLKVSRPGAHQLLLSLPSGISVLDSVTLLTNRPRTLNYVLPRITDDGGFVRVPGGSYYVSSRPPSDSTPTALERVELRPFFIARREVTNRQFCSFLSDVDTGMERDTTCREGYTLLMERLFPVDWRIGILADSIAGYVPAKGLEDHPAVGMTREASELYCEWLTENPPQGLSELRFELPTTHQWEASARAGRRNPYPWGDGSPTGGRLNLSDSRETVLQRCPGLDDGYSTTAPTGCYPPNPWMIYDMAGNVWEMVVDPEDTAGVLAAGGSWISDSSMCRVDSRLVLESEMGYPFVGLRPAAVTDSSP